MELGSLGLWGLFLGNVLSATIVPFSSEALYIAALAASSEHLSCFVVASLGSWIGSVITYWCGHLGRLEWLEKYFKVKKETLDKQKILVRKYGSWLALLAWVPVVGDVMVIALGFYRARPVATTILLLIGKSLRFLVWTFILGGF